MKVLISGAGIAGPTLAYWLARWGYEPSLIERAPRLRTGGYVIDFWGLGFDVSERMGLLPDLRAVSYPVQEVRCVDSRGRRAGGFDTSVFDHAMKGRYLSLARGDLAAAIYRRLDAIPILFGEEIESLHQVEDGVEVAFTRSAPQKFDLLIGADGLHSRVRQLVFGRQPDPETYLGYKVAALEVSGYRPREENVYFMYSQPGLQLSRFALRGDRTLFLFLWADERPDLPDRDSWGAVLSERFRGQGWECEAALDEVARAEDLYFDRVSQIRLESWSQGRTALIGDAAFCVSLLAGQGSALAMTAAYVLAWELKAAGGDHATAFRRYQERLDRFLKDKQSGARRLAGTFAPRTRLGIFLRNQMTRLLRVGWIADRVMAGELGDTLELPPEP